MNAYFSEFLRLTALTMTVLVIGCNSTDTNTATTSDDAEWGEAWKPVDCDTLELPALVSILSDCGYVTVPERHSQPDSPTIELAVVRTRSIGKNPAPDPLFVEQGGPGTTTIGVFTAKAFPNYPELPAILESRDLIFVEERGTQYSRPFLACPELTDHNIAVAKGEVESTDVAWLETCRDRHSSQGVNIDTFNTVENAADIYFVAEVLGYEQFNYYGVSYGTLLGQYVIEQAEEHSPQLRSVIIDGVVKPDIDFNLAVTHTMSNALRNLFADCAQDKQCNQAYPNLEKVFLSLLDQLDQNPVPLTLTVPKTGETIEITLNKEAFLQAVLPFLYQTSLSRLLPSRIYQASQGDFSWVERNLSDGLENTDAKEMYHSVLCARNNSIQVEPSSLFPEPYKQLISLGIAASQEVKAACEVLDIEPEKVFVYDNTNIPTLVLNGTYDPVTPQAYGEAVASNLETAYVYTFPGIGHGVLFAPPDLPAADCVTDITLNFLNNPMQTPDSNCLNEVKPVFEYE